MARHECNSYSHELLVGGATMPKILSILSSKRNETSKILAVHRPRQERKKAEKEETKRHLEEKAAASSCGCLLLQRAWRPSCALSCKSGGDLQVCISCRMPHRSSRATPRSSIWTSPQMSAHPSGICFTVHSLISLLSWPAPDRR